MYCESSIWERARGAKEASDETVVSACVNGGPALGEGMLHWGCRKERCARTGRETGWMEEETGSREYRAFRRV